MTESLDLDALEAVARASFVACEEDWYEVNSYTLHTPTIAPVDREFIAAFSPAVAADLIGRVREAEAKAANWAEIDRLALDNVLTERDAALARAQATEAELLEAHAHFAVQEGRLREAVARAEKAEGVIERVRSIHRFETYAIGGSTRDDATYTRRCALCATSFPCPTIRALGGDQS